MISMKNYVTGLLALLFTLMPLSKADFSVFSEPLSESELLNIAKNIMNEYKDYIYAVQASSKIIDKKDSNSSNNKIYRKSKKIGTAFPVDDKGHLVTLRCIVKNAEKVTVITHSGEETSAEIVDDNKSGRIAILKMDSHYSQKMPPIARWNSIHTENDVILLCRCPENRLLTKPGKISEVRDSDGIFIITVKGNPETTAGTPVFDTDKKLLGIIAYQVKKESKLESDELEGDYSYIVIPMEYTAIIANTIVNKPETRNGWLGVFVSAEIKDTDGVGIQYIVHESPAAKCGLRPHDSITEFNGKPVLTSNELLEATASTKSGDTVTIKVKRDGKILSFDATLY